MTLTEAKRRLVVGKVIDAIGHFRPAASGPRTITKVQTNGFWWEGPASGNGKGWTEWPKASLTRSDGPDRITVLFADGEPMSTFIIPA